MSEFGQDADRSDHGYPQILYVKQDGIWSSVEFERHFQALADAIQSQRAEYGRSRVLVDARQAVVQSQEVSGFIQRALNQIHREGDKVAIVSHGALLRMQMKRVTDASITCFFEKIEDAETWLVKD